MHLPLKIKIFLFLIIFVFFLNPKNLVLAMVVEDAGGAGGGFYDPSYWEHTKELKKDQEEKSISTTSFTQTFISNIFNGVTHTVVGEVCEKDDQECIQRLQTYGGGGALGGVASLISLLYANPPASGAEYLADLGQSFGITQPAYAQQGIGFKYFTPILRIWKITRNIAYLAFVIVFIVTGLAIMFRVKISPQAVLTLESALPKVIIALIIVTFSYAIAGFLIDLIYILIGLVFTILKSNTLLDTAKAAQVFYNPDLKTLIGEYFGRGREFASALAGNVAQIIHIPLIEDIPGIGPRITSSLLTLILILALLFACFKLFFSLLMCYINIILSVIIGPLVIMMSALPGQEGNSFTGWLKNLLSNILVFPAVISIFLLADAIRMATKGLSEPIWAPPFLFPTDSELVGSLISYGLLLLAPQIPSYVKALFEPKAKVTPPAQAFFAPIGGAFGVAKAPITYPGGVVKEAWEKKAVTELGQIPAKDVREKGLGWALKRAAGAFSPFATEKEKPPEKTSSPESEKIPPKDQPLKSGEEQRRSGLYVSHRK
jgi:hypothetical protein